MKQVIATHLIKMDTENLTDTLQNYYDLQGHWSIFSENRQSASDEREKRWLHHATLG